MLSEQRVERYELLGELATGGMATVYLGRQRGPFGFMRTVAIKSMHPQFAKDESFRAMFLDEANLTAKIRHPNVVPTLDVIYSEGKVLIVMEYVEGVSLSTLLGAAKRTRTTLPPNVVSTIMCDALHGLQAAHDLADDDGSPLGVVHRDVSPQNIHIGADGLARVLDFGVAKAASRRYVTQSGEIKGKLAYMSSEQVAGEDVDRRTDVYAAGVVLWEALVMRRLFDGKTDIEVVKKVMEGKIDPPSLVAEEQLSEAVDRVVLKALGPTPGGRWASAEEMANALASVLPPAPRSDVAHLVKTLAAKELESRATKLRTPIQSKPDLAAIATEPMMLEEDAKTVLDALTAHTMESSPAIASAAAAARNPPPKSSWKLVAITAGLIGLIAVTSAAFVIGARTAKTEPPVAPPAVSSVAVEPPPPPSSPAPPSSSSAPPPPPAPPPSASAVSPVKKKPKPGHSAKPDCRVPYTVDAHGDRHYRPECVE